MTTTKKSGWPSDYFFYILLWKNTCIDDSNDDSNDDLPIQKHAIF